MLKPPLFVILALPKQLASFCRITHDSPPSPLPLFQDIRQTYIFTHACIPQRNLNLISSRKFKTSCRLILAWILEMSPSPEATCFSFVSRCYLVFQFTLFLSNIDFKHDFLILISPYRADIEKHRIYYWVYCRSSNQPSCRCFEIRSP